VNETEHSNPATDGGRQRSRNDIREDRDTFTYNKPINPTTSPSHFLTLPLNFLPPQIHHPLPSITPLPTPIHLPQPPHTIVKRICIPLRVKIKRHIALPGCPHTQKPSRHGQIDPVGAAGRQDAALAAARLEGYGVVGGLEDEDGFKGLQGDEGGEEGWWGHDG
jgi:hypothetical protein